MIYRKQHIDSPAPEHYRQNRLLPADPKPWSLRYASTHQGVSLTWQRLQERTMTRSEDHAELVPGADHTECLEYVQEICFPSPSTNGNCINGYAHQFLLLP